MQHRKLWLIDPGLIHVHLCKGFCVGGLINKGVIFEGAYNWNRHSTLKQATMYSSADQIMCYF